MKDALATYYDDMAKHVATADNTKERAALLRYHAQRVAEFQHERLVHLLVTMFVGLLAVTACVCLIIITQTASLAPFLVPMTLLTAILLVLEVSYLLYYYHLENATQKLYEITAQLGPPR